MKLFQTYGREGQAGKEGEHDGWQEGRVDPCVHLQRKTSYQEHILVYNWKEIFNSDHNLEILHSSANLKLCIT